ncbi:hypothetical protein VTN77DRAFT_9489 [Rasamsonia byssochlamydoides]|uniref:uncharacterized protein n=1 Tax=Rasamsonia byssochlamydoides TaxID=89139 RepID=UPI003742E5E6
MDGDHIPFRSWDALAERRIPNLAPRATPVRESVSSGRFTGRRNIPFNRNRKWVVVAQHDDEVDDGDDGSYDLDVQPVAASIIPIPTFVPAPETTTVTITGLAATATATAEADNCYLGDQDPTTGQVDSCERDRSSPSNDHYQSHSALQTGPEKAGLVVGLTVGVSLIVFLIVFLTLRRKYGPSFTLWSCITRRKRSSLNGSSGFNEKHKWMSLSDGEGGGARPYKAKPRPVTLTVKEMDAGPVDTFTRMPSLRSLKRHSKSSAMVTSEKAYYDDKTSHSTPIARLTIGTRSSGSWGAENEKALLDLMRESESESEPSRGGRGSTMAKKRRPGMSFFSWSTAPTTPAASSVITNSNYRETIMTDDSEPPRFRSIYSWVNHQSERQQRLQQRQTSGTVEFLPPPIIDRRSNFPDNPPYPPTPPIPRRCRDVEDERVQSFLQSPSLMTVEEGDRLSQLSQPAKAVMPSSAGHNRMRSSTTVSTLPVFREHPGEEVDIGMSRVGRIRSSSLQRILGPYDRL